MPPEIYDISGAVIAEKLKQRIKDLPKYAEDYYELLAKDHLVAVHPDVGHDFPPDVREAAYAFVDKWLKK